MQRSETPLSFPNIMPLNNLSNNTKRRPRSRNGKRGGRSDGDLAGRFPMSGTLMIRNSTLGIPKRVRTTLRLGLQGYLAAGSAATGNAYTLANQLTGPFNTGSASFATGWGLTLTDSSSSGSNPTSVVFWSAGYQSYRILSTSFKVTAVCGAAGDSMNVWIYPIPVNDSIYSQRLQYAVGQPGFKRMMITSGMRPSSITSNFRPAQILGLPAREYNNSPFTSAAVGSAPNGGSVVSVVCCYATMDGAVTSQQVYFEYELQMEVEFFNIIQQNP
jgi:hypothetical protein